MKTFELAKTVGTISLGEAKDIEKIETAIAAVSKAAGEFGSVQNRLQYTQSNLAIYSQNLSAAQSSIVDANMAAETTNFTKDQVLAAGRRLRPRAGQVAAAGSAEAARINLTSPSSAAAF